MKLVFTVISEESLDKQGLRSPMHANYGRAMGD